MREHLLQQLDSVYAGYYKVPNDCKSSDIVIPPPMAPPLPALQQSGGAGNGGGGIMWEGNKTSENANDNKNSLNCSVENKVAPVYRLWNLNRPEMLYLIVGMVGGIITGLLAPAEGFFLAKITVS